MTFDDKQLIYQLNEINKKIDNLHLSISTIDLAITGDEKRGILGVKNHIERLDLTFENHTNSDERNFDLIIEKNRIVDQTIIQTKSWIAGATFICVTVTPLLVFLVNYIIKNSI